MRRARIKASVFWIAVVSLPFPAITHLLIDALGARSALLILLPLIVLLPTMGVLFARRGELG